MTPAHLLTSGSRLPRLCPSLARPYRVEVPGTSLVIRCEVFAIAMREAEQLAKRMKVDVHIYEGERLLRTIKAPT